MSKRNLSVLSGQAARLMGTCVCSLLLGFAEHVSGQAISVTGGNIVMNITTAVAGSEPTAVTNTTITLTYRRQNLLSKITVQTSCPSQKFNLQVVATSVTDGVAAPTVTLTNGMLATDFITSIPAKPPSNTRTCTLNYTASSTFAQGNSTELGNDVHTVTYTILVQ